ncbi:hypothetical protein BO221_21085 [Archangium sp. Cb G35]|uniref:hypothetical protein n=1 Tax=Archangium sp. Cb G35 TaxID=1920190 RepID=UPI00093644F1|nr:hypothetical protein [Archangium sp. Cb G35]OJT22294.1 hypothetical protein BO221_21085 [Archangium sp. Cb G35]
MIASDPSRLIAAHARDQSTLNLKTVDLCFGLYLRADRAAPASFEEDMLVDVVEPGAEKPEHARDARDPMPCEQRMLEQVEGAGIGRMGSKQPSDASHCSTPRRTLCAS